MKIEDQGVVRWLCEHSSGNSRRGRKPALSSCKEERPPCCCLLSTLQDTDPAVPARERLSSVSHSPGRSCGRISCSVEVICRRGGSGQSPPETLVQPPEADGNPALWISAAWPLQPGSLHPWSCFARRQSAPAPLHPPRGPPRTCLAMVHHFQSLESIALYLLPG